MNDYVDKLWNSDAVACLDALKEADEAVETINRDMFAIIADVASDVVMQSRTTPHQQVKEILKQFEQKYKKERSLKHMPGSYRSAKSVIVNAVKHGISLTVATDGSTRGKSALEREIKQVVNNNKKQDKGNSSGAYLFDVYMRKVNSMLSSLYPSPLTTDMTKEELNQHLDRMESHIAEIRTTYGV